MQQIVEAFDTKGNVTLAGGDIVINVDQSLQIENSANRASGQIRLATLILDAKIFGVSVFETQSWVRYSHNEINIIDVLGGNTFISKNYHPLMHVNISGQTTYKDATNAYHSADLSWSYIHSGLGLIYASNNVGVWGNVRNQMSGWVN